MEATRPTAASALSRASLWYGSGDVCAPSGQTVGGGTGLYLTPAPGVSKWRVSKRGTASPRGAWRWHGEVIATKSPNKYALSPPAAFSAHHHPSTPDDLSSVSPSFPLSTLPSLFFLFPLSSLHPSPPQAVWWPLCVVLHVQPNPSLLLCSFPSTLSPILVMPQIKTKLKRFPDPSHPLFFPFPSFSPPPSSLLPSPVISYCLTHAALPPSPSSRERGTVKMAKYEISFALNFGLPHRFVSFVV